MEKNQFNLDSFETGLFVLIEILTKKKEEDLSLKFRIETAINKESIKVYVTKDGKVKEIITITNDTVETVKKDE